MGKFLEAVFLNRFIMVQLIFRNAGRMAPFDCHGPDTWALHTASEATRTGGVLLRSEEYRGDSVTLSEGRFRYRSINFAVSAPFSNFIAVNLEDETIDR